MCSCRRASPPVRVHIYTYICVSVRCGLLSLFLFSTPPRSPTKARRREGELRCSSDATHRRSARQTHTRKASAKE